MRYLRTETRKMTTPASSGIPVRGGIAKIMHSKILADIEERTADHTFWYKVENFETLSDDLREKFVQGYEDDETEDFLSLCYEKSDWMFMQIYHSLARSVLSWFMTPTSVNAYLGRGSMFVASQPQFTKLLNLNMDTKLGSLLDLGAGDGKVTNKIAEFFDKVYATEISSQMRARLEEQKYELLDIDKWQTKKYDVISCLNLLDRCDKPLQLMSEIRESLTSSSEGHLGGRLLLAVVIPFKSYVEEAVNKDHAPTELLNVTGNTFAKQIQTYVDNVFTPSGFTVEQFSRLPYLCEGDMSRSFYILHAVVFCLKVT